MRHVNPYTSVRSGSQWFLSALIVFWLAACGGGGGGGTPPAPNPFPVSISSPTFLADYQSDSASLALSGSAFVPTGSLCQCSGLACLFGRGTVAPGYDVTWTNTRTGVSGGASFYLNCLLQVKVIWNAVVPLDPGDNLIRVTAVDASGNAGEATLNATRLPDATPPQIAGITPADGAGGIGINVSASVRFNETMDAASIDTTTLLLSDMVGNPIASSVEISGASANAWLIVPVQALDFATNYRITVSTGVRDLAGNALSAPVTASFTTTPAPDIIPPTLTAASPPDGSGCAGSNTLVVATFSEWINLNTLSFTLTGPGGLPVSGSVSHQEGTLFWSFHAHDGLAPGVAYTANVAAGLTDFSNNATTVPLSWTFSTSGDGVDRCI